MAQHPLAGSVNERSFRITPAAAADVLGLHELIVGLATYEGLADICVATPEDLTRALFGDARCAEALIARLDANPEVIAGFALFFQTYSTFLGRPTLWLEDLFVRAEHRGNGVGAGLLRALAAIAVDRRCGRFEWTVLDWNATAIRFYQSLGAAVLPDWRIARVTGDALARLAEGHDAAPRKQT